jgi:hypothetical protein
MSAIEGKRDTLMFSLKETDAGKFIYRCHACGWECELMATDQGDSSGPSSGLYPIAQMRRWLFVSCQESSEGELTTSLIPWRARQR